MSISNIIIVALIALAGIGPGLAAHVGAASSGPAQSGATVTGATKEQESAAPAVKPQEKRGYVCPKTKYLDCMPPVREENRAMCSKEYLEWIRGSCPGVKVVY